MKKLALVLVLAAAVTFLGSRGSSESDAVASHVFARPAAPFALAELTQGFRRDTSVAPAGAWQCEGGSLSRSRVTDTLPVQRGPLEPAARIEPAGLLEAEPVFDDRYLITVSVDTKGKRQLEVFDIATGKRSGSAKKLDVDERVSPCFVDGLLAVRSGLSEIEVYKVGRSGLKRSWALNTKEGEFGHPLLVDGDIVVTRGDSIERWAPRKSKPTWSVAGVFRGMLSLSDGTLYAVDYDRRTNEAQIVEINVETGAIDGRRGIGQREGGVPIFPGKDLVAVRGKRAIVFADNRVQLEGGLSSRSLGIDLSQPSDPNRSAILNLSTFMIDPPAMLGTAWMSFFDLPSEGRIAAVSNGSTRNPDAEPGSTGPMILAQVGWHDEVLKNHQSPGFARYVSYFAGLAWDATTSRVLWREPRLLGATLYPAHEAVVAVRDSAVVEVWRRHRDPAPEDAIVAHTRPAAAKGLLILRDGSVETGSFELRGEDAALEVAKVGSGSSRGYAATTCLFAAQADGTVLFAADRDALQDGLARMILEDQIEAIDKLCGVAAKCGNIPLMTQVLVTAITLGVEDTEKLEEALAAAREKAPRENEKNSERTREGLAELRIFQRDKAWHALEALYVAPTEGARVRREIYALLEMVLRADHAFEPARARLVELLPEGIELPEDEAIVDWTAFAEANALYPVELWYPPQSFDKALQWEQEKLDDASRWREDIIGFRSKNLFIITPLARPGSVARCLALSEQLCSILEEMFADGEHERDSRDPLVMYLFESKDEYLRVSAGETKEEQASLAWTAGHYNKQDRVSRLYTPEGDADWSSVTETLLHELTHHWVDMRCPRIPADARYKEIGAQRGYWIVEGFASLLEDFQLDPWRGTFATTSPRSSRLDLVTNARNEQLLQWKMLFRREHIRLGGLQGESFDAFPLTWSLGQMSLPGGVGLFYAQSATVCHYCYNAEDGKFRQPLFDYLVSYYTGDTERLAVEDVFGITEEELGKRATTWARDLVRSSLGK